MKSGMNLQDSFLNQVRREASEVRVLLVNGTLLRGVVKGFDNFTVILAARNGQQNLVYKHAIAQVVSQRSGRREDDALLPESDEQEESVQVREEVPVEEKPAAKPAPRRETFNALDLSKIRLGDSSPSEAPAK